MIPTPHLEAKAGDIAETVLMPGDPLRAKFIAENFLESPVCYNNVRGMLGFTGKFNGKTVSVQGSGMGMPSMGIYSYELFNYYGVKNIIRIGTAGALSGDLNVGDVIFAMSASTNSSYASQFGLNGSFAPTADFGLLLRAVNEAEKLNIKYMAGNVFSSDTFYSDDSKDQAMLKWKNLGVLAVEMECAALYINAARAGKNALGILTVSDCIFTGESATSKQRQTAFTDMMKIALNCVS